MDAHQLWQATLGQLELQLTKSTFDTWIKNTQCLSYEDGVLVVGAHSAYAKDWLENRLYAPIQRTASEIAHRTLTIRFVVQRNGSVRQAETGLLDRTVPQASQVGRDGEEADIPRFNARYSFEAFVVGKSNRLAHAGCLAVAESPGLAYNPLFIYGGAGLGKTHLLHAIGNRVAQDQRRALYVAAENFANELINSIRNRTTEEFRAKYRTIDVLLLDDVQFIVDKERTQEEFFHTFNDLYQDNRQIVLSSDRPPKAFVGLEERLRSRFEWGLIVDVQPADIETRIAILKAKAEQRRVQLPDEVLAFVAQRVQSNIRELEGALNRVLALARMMEYPLTIQTAQKALAEAGRSLQAPVTAEHILAVVCAFFGVAREDLLGPRRNRELAVPRQVAMYLIRELTDLSLPRIGAILGGRDHTTIMYGCEKMSALFEKDDALRRQILDIKNRLSGPVVPATEQVGERRL